MRRTVMPGIPNKIYIDGCIDSYEQELEEVQQDATSVKGWYYSAHHGEWILQFISGADMEFDTKAQMMQFIKDDDGE